MPGGRPASEPLPRIEDIQRDFPQFEIVALIGRGGMGHVYKARQRTLGRVVALKLLPARLAGSGDFTERFESEARAMARLSHPNIVTIHDYGQTAAGQSYLVMEFIEGTNLAERMRGGRLPAAEALDIASQVCSALDWAHGNGIVHRDVKPANIVIDTAGRVKLADFGVAALIRKGSSMLKLTTSPSAFGSLDYMSPEQRQGQPPDERGDLFSLGVILYEMLCDDLPHGVFTRASRRVGCDHRIDGIIDRAMQQDLPRRYQRAAAMKTDLDTARGVLTLPAVRHLQLSRMLWTVAAAVLVIIVISMVAGDR
ncbi:MAG: serine/threonine-protein kinase, partial [Chthoniobacteraceae bacterium]